MFKERLSKTSRVVNLNDLIEARGERTSAFADDVDGSEDIESTDVDVDDALTFPHPRRGEVLAGEPEQASDEEESAFDYEDSTEEMLPSDYGELYSDAISTELSDQEDVNAEEDIRELGDITPEDIIYSSSVIETPDEGGPVASDEE
jgi:hypothetical protein